MLKPRLHKTVYSALLLLVFVLSGRAEALALERFQDVAPDFGAASSTLEVAQSGGMSLSQAVDSVRRRGNVERVISAETRVSGGREVHYVKVLTKDGKVRTHKIPGRRRS